MIDGCDWSATTAVTRLFKRLPYFADSSSGHDDELDGALLLSGLRGKRRPDAIAFRPVTSVRASVNISLTRTSGSYGSCASRELLSPRCSATEGKLYRAAPPGDWPASPAAMAHRVSRKPAQRYLASIRQTLELEERLGERIAIVDYDELAAERAQLLPALCRFASVPFDNHLLRHLHGKSVRKGVLASWEAMVIDQLTLPAYRRARVAARLSLAESRDTAKRRFAAEDLRARGRCNDCSGGPIRPPDQRLARAPGIDIAKQTRAQAGIGAFRNTRRQD